MIEASIIFGTNPVKKKSNSNNSSISLFSNLDLYLAHAKRSDNIKSFGFIQYSYRQLYRTVTFFEGIPFYFIADVIDEPMIYGPRFHRQMSPAGFFWIFCTFAVRC